MTRWWAAVVLSVAALCGGIAIAESAESRSLADRLEHMQVTATVPPPDPATLVRAITYRFGDPGPAWEAFKITAGSYGWSQAKLALWKPFVIDVMLGESHFCPNVARWAIIAPDSNCVVERQGVHDDAGIAQITAVWYGQGKWLCVNHGICSRSAILSDPWISFRSFFHVIDEFGSDPWCFSEWARGYHHCDRLAPDR